MPNMVCPYCHERVAVEDLESHLENCEQAKDRSLKGWSDIILGKVEGDKEVCMESLVGRKVNIYIAQRQPDGKLVNVSIQGEVTAQSGDDEKVGKVVLEAEQRGNSGSVRIHISL